MNILQPVLLLLVAITGTAVALTRDPVQQAAVGAVYGLELTVLFVLFGAPDVAFSVLGAGGVAVPLMQVAAIASTRANAARR